MPPSRIVPDDVVDSADLPHLAGDRRLRVSAEEPEAQYGPLGLRGERKDSLPRREIEGCAARLRRVADAGVQLARVRHKAKRQFCVCRPRLDSWPLVVRILGVEGALSQQLEVPTLEHT